MGRAISDGGELEGSLGTSPVRIDRGVAGELQLAGDRVHAGIVPERTQVAGAGDGDIFVDGEAVAAAWLAQHEAPARDHVRPGRQVAQCLRVSDGQHAPGDGSHALVTIRPGEQDLIRAGFGQADRP